MFGILGRAPLCGGGTTCGGENGATRTRFCGKCRVITVQIASDALPAFVTVWGRRKQLLCHVAVKRTETLLLIPLEFCEVFVAVTPFDSGFYPAARHVRFGAPCCPPACKNADRPCGSPYENGRPCGCGWLMRCICDCLQAMRCPCACPASCGEGLTLFFAPRRRSGTGLQTFLLSDENYGFPIPKALLTFSSSERP